MQKIGTVRCQGRDLVQRVKEQLGQYEEQRLGVVPVAELPTDDTLAEIQWQLGFLVGSHG